MKHFTLRPSSKYVCLHVVVTLRYYSLYLRNTYVNIHTVLLFLHVFVTLQHYSLYLRNAFVNIHTNHITSVK